MPPSSDCAQASYSGFYLADIAARTPEEDLPLFERNGLVTPSEGIAVVRSQLCNGDVLVEIETFATELRLEPEFNWGEIVEVSTLLPVGHARLRTVYLDTIPGAPAISAVDTGWYRLRAHARGWLHIETSDEMSEYYLIQAWPSGERPETIYRLPDLVSEANRWRIVDDL